MGWIITGSIIAALVAVLLIPLKASLSCGEAIKLDLSWAFWKQTIIPFKEKEEKAEENEEEAGTGAKKPKKKRKLSAEELIDTALDYLGRCGGGAKLILRDLRVKLLVIDWTIAAEDAAECAIRYGKMCAYLSASLATARNFVRIQKVKLLLRPDFTVEEEKFSAEAEIRATPLVVIAGLLGIGWGMLMKMITDLLEARKKAERRKKAAAKRRAQISASKNGI